MSSSLLATTTSTVAVPTPTLTPVPEEEEYYSSWSLFLVCGLLIMSLWTSYYLQIKRIRAIHETLVAIIGGMFVGLVVRLAPGTMIREMLTFKHTLFFNLLLPPIILNSGYELKQENFFRNFGSILTFAFLGTFISAVGVGVLVYIYSFLGLESLEVTLIECLIFGSTLSATDPVTILAIFNQYKVDPKLYTVIFGESLLNDAVSIVMYETLTQFHGTEIYVSSLFHGTGIFLLSFSVSMALGVVFGLAMSLILKHSSLALYPSIETCLVALSAYTCYFFSNGLSMSGIVSLLFCGITLKHYAYHTMSRRTQRATKYIFSTLAQLSENFIFIYLGLSLFTSPPSSEKVTSYFKPLFITITTVAVVFTRYAAVFPLSEAINFFHRHARGQRQEELPHSYQMMLFWAGLRGAVGVALAAGFKGDSAQTLRTTVLVVVVLTVVVFGGTTARMLEVLGIRTGVEDETATSDDDEEIPIGRPGWYNRRSTRWNALLEDEGGVFASQQAAGYPRSAPGRMTYEDSPRMYNHQLQNVPLMNSAHPMFSAASTDSFDSDGEVLPLATAPVNGSASPGGRRKSRDNLAGPSTEGTEEGKWFQQLDERYLLPLFSNATASRTFHARKARRASGVGTASGSRIGSPAGSDDEGDDGTEVDLTTAATRAANVNHDEARALTPGVMDQSRTERGLASPMLRRDSEGQNRDRASL
ncbi:sodium/hydrogen exchanger [Laetiporus sulphureus 93-53]|uniref:Sodium/hydrogen exchanger n=1 Tax=Laetiporus sulphureus 93-53 TaxID=1314785 RepID=A0A165CQV4_9APHY|nr:sodium/hydrogen exchanger [Laetiporus sulphureus 93-53]KZT03257.1 sodium/hydrogen exchanger [Laetiporus sulphureus 93-53]